MNDRHYSEIFLHNAKCFTTEMLMFHKEIMHLHCNYDSNVSYSWNCETNATDSHYLEHLPPTEKKERSLLSHFEFI